MTTRLYTTAKGSAIHVSAHEGRIPDYSDTGMSGVFVNAEVVSVDRPSIMRGFGSTEFSLRGQATMVPTSFFTDLRDALQKPAIIHSCAVVGTEPDTCKACAVLVVLQEVLQTQG